MTSLHSLREDALKNCDYHRVFVSFTFILLTDFPPLVVPYFSNLYSHEGKHYHWAFKKQKNKKQSNYSLLRFKSIRIEMLTSNSQINDLPLLVPVPPKK